MFPDGELEGAVLHWALAGRASAPWQRPPAGWATDPAATNDAGAHAIRKQGPWPRVLSQRPEGAPGACFTGTGRSACRAGETHL